MGHEIVVLGMSERGRVPWRSIMLSCLMGSTSSRYAPCSRDSDLGPRASSTPAQRSRVIGVLAKAEAGRSGRLRGYRHTMLDDSDISATRHARAFVCGALAGLIGHAELYVSGGAEHQGPDGGGPVAVIARRD